MKVDDLVVGMPLRTKPGTYIYFSTSFTFRQMIFSSEEDERLIQDAGGDFYRGDEQVILYLGHRRDEGQHLLREVMWNGEIFHIRPQDWRLIEPIVT